MKRTSPYFSVIRIHYIAISIIYFTSHNGRKSIIKPGGIRLFLANPEYYEKLIEFSLHRFDDYTHAYMESGLDAFLMGGNVPGGFIGKNNYDNYVLPYEKQCISMPQSSGIPCIYHNCGVNQVDIIQKGTVEDVIAATKQTAAAIKTTGYNIIQNADFLKYNTPVENVRAFVKTARENSFY